MVVCSVQSFATEQSLKEHSRRSTGTRRHPENKVVHFKDFVMFDSDNIRNRNGVDDDREEGEIVDEYEMIISSEDEEFKLRARIQQLEDENKDLEKISVLSDNLANQYRFQKPPPEQSRYHTSQPVYVLSDISSGSEDNITPPKRHHKHKSKRLESKQLINNYDIKRNPYARRTHGQRKKRRHNGHHHHHQHHQPADTILIDSLDSMTDSEICEYDASIDDEAVDLDLEQLKVSRDKLRLALARSISDEIMPKYSLKERLRLRSNELQHRSRERLTKNVFTPFQDEDLELPERPLSDLRKCTKACDTSKEERKSQSPVELKLRLIALKSVILKKHFARKKRDAERAYSPTDMINLVHPATINNNCDIDDLMDISPASSPEPTSTRQEFNDNEMGINMKSVDMDLVETDSDMDQNSKDQWARSDWHTTDRSQVEQFIPSTNNIQWPYLMSESLPSVSMPRASDDVPPPPPPYHMPQAQLHDENATEAPNWTAPDEFNSASLMDVESLSIDNSQTSRSKSFCKALPESSEDEAGVLRAMLLSKLKPSVSILSSSQELPSAPVKSIQPSKTSPSKSIDSDDPEELRSLLLSSIASKKRNDAANVSPMILKKAVKRFQVNLDKEKKSDRSHLEEDSVNVMEINKKLPVPKISVESKQDVSEKAIVNTTSSESVLPSPLVLSTNTPLQTQSTPDINATVVPLATKSASACGKKVSPLQMPPREVKSAAPSTSSVVKIVRPNKIINKTTTQKRKLLLEGHLNSKRPATLMVKEASTPILSHNGSVSTTRLITAVDSSSIKVNKLVIKLGESATDSDDNDENFRHLSVDEIKNNNFNSANHSDDRSPLSMSLDSASNSTTRSNTPSSEILETAPSNNSKRTLINEYFEKKLDDFLKQARSKVLTAPVLPCINKSPVPAKGPVKAPLQNDVLAQPNNLLITPVAVKHLPVASQEEYVRLIERMQELERRKHQVTKPTNASVPIRKTKQKTPIPTKKGSQKMCTHKVNGRLTTAPSLVSSLVDNKTAKNDISTQNEAANNTGPETDKQVAYTKSKLTADAIVNGPSEELLATIDVMPTNSKSKNEVLPQPTKENRLKAYENSFLKIGVSMISNLERSLQMVENAKESKIARLCYSKRLKDLYAEIHSIKQNVKLEEAKLARIHPEIQASHEIILSLKQKRNNLYNAAMDLGKGLKGDNYRLMDERKSEISHKSTQLTKEIRSYNSFVTYEDLALLRERCQADINAVPSEINGIGTNNSNQEQRSLIKKPQFVGDNSSSFVQALINETSVSSNNSVNAPTVPKTSDATAERSPTPVCSSMQAASETEQHRIEDNVESAEAVEPQNTDEAAQHEQEEKQQIIALAALRPGFMRELREEPLKKSLLKEYNSPISRNYNRDLDVNGMMCPFELMGRCEDTDCSYMHLTRTKRQTTQSSK